jgi:dynein heavy chain
MGKDEEPKKEGDQRLPAVYNKVWSVFGFTKSKKEKAVQALDEATKGAIQAFLNDKSCNYLFLFPSGDGVFTGVNELPALAMLKKKALVVHKARANEGLTSGNIGEQMVTFEFTRNVMELLNTFCHSIYLSTLSNPANQRGWSDLISKDLIDKYHVFLANLHVTVGLMSGKTLLPLPPKEATIDRGQGQAAANNKDRVHILESAVITWTKQISHVLKQDPESLIKDGNNPDPLVELAFWRNKAANLNVIHAQLQSEHLKKVLKFLEQNKSTYTNPFSRLQKEVEQARDEATDNDHFLKTLQGHFDLLVSESADFEKLDQYFDGILHTILLIWKYSKYYNTPARLVVLMREICNVIIAQACRYISGPQIFNMIQNEEAKEAVDKLEKTLEICTAFRDKYFLYKDIAEQQSNGGWKIQSNALFVRLDAFRERCRDILDFTKTIVQFFKLERIDIGGTKGKLLTATIQNIYEEFKLAVSRFQAVEYDIMDITGDAKRAFDDDFFQFRVSIKELDRRLATVLSLGFDDLDTIQARLKLFDAFEGLLERPILEDELEKKYVTLLQGCKTDLKDVKKLFLENRSNVDTVADNAPFYSNMPPVAGAIYWARSLKARINQPMSKLLVVNKIVKERPEDFKEIDKLYNNLVETLEDYELKKYNEWQRHAVEGAKDKLKMRLLRRVEKTGLLKVNFDPALVRMLREVRYFLLFGLQVPETALEIYQRADVYRRWVGQLDIVVQKYNAVLTELLPVEEPLLEEKIVKMDSVLSPGLTDLRWKSEDRIPEFITSVSSVVGDVSQVVDAIKGNLKKISAIIEKWCNSPLLERKQKPMTVEEFELVHKSNVGSKLHVMSEEGKEIHKFLKDSAEALKVRSPPPSGSSTSTS